jgi:hypothetical protein
MFNMINLITQEELEWFTKGAIERLGEKDGYTYIGWYLNNGKRIVDEWFGGEYGKDYNNDDMLRNMDSLGDKIAYEYNKWLEEMLVID